MKFLIDFKNDTPNSEIETYINENNLAIVHAYNHFDKVFLTESASTPPKTEIVEEIVQDDSNPIVPLGYPVEPGETLPKVEFLTDSENDWWKVASLFAPDFSIDTQIKYRRGQSAIVYVVDSGIKLDHTEFEFASVSNLFSFNDDFTDHNGHGTAIASLLCGKTCAISDPIVKSVKIFQTGVTTLKSDLIRSFDAIIEDVKNTPDKFHVINLSWGIPRDLYVESKIRALIDFGVWVVAAAGNGGTTIEDITPACMPEVFTIGAYDTDLMPCDFSNYTGPLVTTDGMVNSGELDSWAPGMSIRVAALNGDYEFVGGTSMAAAIHSAAIAYNTYNYCFVDGTPGIFSPENTVIHRVSLGNPDLIVRGEKYARSTNYSTAFITNYDGDGVTYSPMSPAGIRTINAQKEINMLLAPIATVKELVMHQPLPEGLRQEGNWLRGQVSFSDWFVFETPVTYIHHSGSEYNGNIKFIFAPGEPSAFSPDAIAEITAYTWCGGPGDSLCSGDCGGPQAGVCTDACYGIKGEEYCYCYPPFIVCP